MNKNSTILNDLYDTGFKIYQNDEYFKFSLDSLLLAKFVKPDYKDKKILDLCTGNAPIPIILSSNNNFEITGIEMQKEIYHLASESIKINKMKKESLLNKNEIKSIARHEIYITLEEIIKTSYAMLKDKGKLYIIHRTDRMIELINLLTKYKLGIKRLQIIYPNEHSNGSMIIIEAKKNCKHDVKILSPIFTNN